MTPRPDPFDVFSDEELLQLRLATQLTCGRAHGVLVTKRRAWFCILFNTLKVEANLRGLPAPPTTAHVGDLHPPAL